MDVLFFSTIADQVKKEINHKCGLNISQTRILLFFDENKNLFTNFLNAKVSLFEKDMIIQVTDRLTTENAIYSICYEKEVHVEEEILKYEEELKRLEQEVLRCQKMLTNEGFLKKAPLNKINVEKEKLQNYISRKESVQKHLDELKKS